MKSIADSMSPLEAARAFYGQDEVAFAKTIAKMTKTDPRLARIFQNTRRRFLEEERQQ